MNWWPSVFIVKGVAIANIITVSPELRASFDRDTTINGGAMLRYNNADGCIKYTGMFVVGSSLSLSIKVNPSGHVCGGSRVRLGMPDVILISIAKIRVCDRWL